ETPIFAAPGVSLDPIFKRIEPGQMLRIIKQELRMALSKRTQPLRIRTTKWAIFLGVAVVLYGSDFFLYLVVGLPLLGVLTPFIYPWHTPSCPPPSAVCNDLL